jgi:hypothetical protein
MKHVTVTWKIKCSGKPHNYFLLLLYISVQFDEKIQNLVEGTKKFTYIFARLPQGKSYHQHSSKLKNCIKDVLSAIELACRIKSAGPEKSSQQCDFLIWSSIYKSPIRMLFA